MVGARDRAALGRLPERFVAALAIGVTVGSVVAAAIAAPADHVDGLTVILGITAVAAGALVAGTPDGASVSASFLVYVLAGVFLGPRSAAACAVISEVVAAGRLRTRVRSVALVNLPANVVPAVISATIFRAIVSGPSHSTRFYIAVTLAAATAITSSFVIW